MVRLNRAVALAEAGAPERALEEVEALGLEGYQPWHAARAALLDRLGRPGAAEAYGRAAALAGTEAERAWLLGRATVG